MRKPKSLYGSIQTRVGAKGRSTYRVLYREWDPVAGRMKQKAIHCADNFKLARAVQAEVTRKFLNGEFDAPARRDIREAPLSDFTLVRRDDSQAAALRTPIREFIAEYEAKLKIDRARPGVDDVEGSEYFQRDKGYLDEFFGIVQVGTTGEINAHNALTVFREALLARKTRINKDGKAVEAKPLSNASINRRFNALRKMFRYMHKRGYIRDDIASEAGRMEEPEELIVIMPGLQFIVATVKACAAACPAFLPAWWVLLKTGVRRSELVRLEKSWVLREERKLLVYQNKLRRKKFKAVEVDPDAHALLLALADDPTNDTPFLLLNEYGRPWSRDQVSDRTQAIRDNMKGCTKDEARRYVGSQVIRHTCGSAWAKMRGIDVASRQLGHRNLQTTMNHYNNIEIAYVKKGEKSLPWNIWEVHGNKLGNISVPYNTAFTRQTPPNESPQTNTAKGA